MEAQDVTRAQRLLERKNVLGTAASYRKLAAKIDKGAMTVRRVLKEQQSGVPINRTEAMDLIEQALDEIEAEEAAKEPREAEVW